MEELSRQTRIRYLLTLLILITIPCYLLGFIMLRLAVALTCQTNLNWDCDRNAYRHDHADTLPDAYCLDYPHSHGYLPPDKNISAKRYPYRDAPSN